ncbi:CASP-like protein 4B4 [Arachis stenosperma]|uniref:CASP-like protein 4B4 n=1 Tax=Arachis stenosperma TaxID=217475 RepID=UPI0025AD04C3|nr:CASP-like protein 4B4 [Arachis stenosperma]
MAASNDSETKIDVQSVPASTEARSGDRGGDGIAGILQRYRREGFVERVSLCLRGVALVFSFISFFVVVTNEHGDWKQFHKYQEYRYLLAIAILSSLYTGIQCFRQVYGKNMIQPNIAVLVDFFGDQIMAYLLISSASAAIPITNRMREGADNAFTDTSTAAISFSFFAFLCLALSAIISGYKLSTQTNI